MFEPPAAGQCRVAGALAVVDVALRAALAADLWQLTDAELMVAAAQAHRQQCRTEALQLALVREVDKRGAALAHGAPSTAAWLRSGLRMHPADAKRMVATAAALHSDAAGPLVNYDDCVGADGDGAAGDREGTCGSRIAHGLAGSRAALAEGAISAEHVGVIVSALAALPPELDRGTIAAAEVVLAARP